MSDRANPTPPYREITGALAGMLSPDDLAGSLRRTVALLRRVLAADDCELFLREPLGRGLLLAACRGADDDSRIERLAIDNADPERAMARHRQDRGMKSSAQVPLPGPHAPVGWLHVTWRRDDVEVEMANDLLARVAQPIATTIRAGLSALRDMVEEDLETTETTAAAERAFLDTMAATAGARAATLITETRSGTPGASVLCNGDTPNICDGALENGRLQCPVLERGEGQVLSGDRGDWPVSCRAMSPATTAPCCVPLWTDGRLRGAVVLDYGDAPPTPRTRDLAALLAMARTGAAQLFCRGADPPARGTPPPDCELELRCLGTFELRRRGERLPASAFARRKARTLLEALVLARGTPIHRDTLIDWLWPGVDVKAGANRIHGVVHALRAAIEPQPKRGDWTYVRNQGEFYFFNTQAAHWVDAHEFRGLANDGASAEREGRVDDAVMALEQAMALYRGDLFEDEPLADWCAADRIELHRRFLDVVMRMAELAIGTGQPERAVACLQRGLALAPLREDLHQALIQTLADSGRRQEALAQYEECRRILREEVGTEPLPATQRLAALLAAR